MWHKSTCTCNCFWDVLCLLTSSLFEVVGSLQSKQNAGLSEQQQGYLFHMNVVIPHKTSEQAHARLVNYTVTSVTLVLTRPLPDVQRPLSHFNKHDLCQMYMRPLSHFNKHSLHQHNVRKHYWLTKIVLSKSTRGIKPLKNYTYSLNNIHFTA